LIIFLLLDHSYSVWKPAPKLGIQSPASSSHLSIWSCPDIHFGTSSYPPLCLFTTFFPAWLIFPWQ
jgi:hypothetical protein